MVTPPPTAAAGTEIQRLRQAKGLSLRHLARQAGVSAAALSRWESLKRLPSIPELEAVLTALDASTAQKCAVLRLIDAPRAVHRLRALEETTAEDYNSGGALLWAMRQRKGWTQTRTAQASGFTQAQITRWENGDSWPSTADLHTLCWCLEAHPEEVAALTGRPNNAPVRRAGGNALLPKEAVRGWDSARWAEYVASLLWFPPPEPLLSLTFIGVQQHLSHLAAAQDGFAATLLPDAYAIHARHCLSRQQTKQAVHWAEQGLALVRRQQISSPAGVGSAPTWFGNVLVLASAFGRNKRAAEQRRAGKLLSDWLPVVRRGVESRDKKLALSAAAHHAWGQMMQANNLHRRGHTHAAVERAKIACEEGEQLNPGEGFMRLHDFARLLRDTDQPDRALQALAQSEKLLSLDRVQTATRVRHHLLEAECLSALGDKQSGSERVRAVEQLVAHGDLPNMQAEWQRVASRF